ncbi:hypothetical protein BC829DRAFT_401589 [Chytridium lagenaria]|nr:hypothetical protein BC829DRAFT_401589 [Chytridium lagenaria]
MVDLHQELKLTTTNTERESYETLAELFSIFKKAYIRDAITPQEYTPACTKLIAQFKTARDLYGRTTGELEMFLKDYKVRILAKCVSLILEFPATVEHAVAESGSSSRQHVKLVADVTTREYDGHKRKIKDWLITLNKMKASDGLTDDQSRQLLFELDSANQAFHNGLDL